MKFILISFIVSCAADPSQPPADATDIDSPIVDASVSRPACRPCDFTADRQLCEQSADACFDVQTESHPITCDPGAPTAADEYETAIGSGVFCQDNHAAPTCLPCFANCGPTAAVCHALVVNSTPMICDPGAPYAPDEFSTDGVRCRKDN